MKIIIEAVELGWSTRRCIQIPDDEKLLKAILGCVKRHEQKKEKEETPPFVAEPLAEEKAQAKPKPHAAVQKKERFEGTAYIGFLIVKCEVCGHEKAYNSRFPTRTCRCTECEHKTELNDMVEAKFECPHCKKAWTYKTNSVEAEVSVNCVECGTKMTARWNKEKHYLAYMPVEEPNNG